MNFHVFSAEGAFKIVMTDSSGTLKVFNYAPQPESRQITDFVQVQTLTDTRGLSLIRTLMPSQSQERTLTAFDILGQRALLTIN